MCRKVPGRTKKFGDKVAFDRCVAETFDALGHLAVSEHTVAAHPTERRSDLDVEMRR